jgi:Na+/H+ antiporter NhaD/arsenite permease-like protein
VSGTAWAAIAVFTVAYALIATEKVHRVTAALGGAAVMLLIGATDAEHAFFSEESGIDWNVIFLLVGMMLIVAVLKQTGAFEYIAIWAAKRARGRPFRVMVILVLVTAVASAALDNVTTVLLIAPVTFLVCERLGVQVAPYLIAEALASNIGGTATLVGDPPNIIIASRGGLSYNDFLIHLAPIVVVLLVVFIGLCRVLFRSAFVYDPARAAQIATLRERDAIRDGRLLVVSVAVLAVVTVAFVLHTALHLEPSVVAIVGGLAPLVLSRLDAGAVAKDVEWPTLVFFAGLFIMGGALVNTGVSSRSRGPRRRRPRGGCCSRRWCCCGDRRCCPPSWTTSRTWPRSARSWRRWSTRTAPTRRRCCGGPSPWAPTWAATPPPSVRPRTWSCWASPNGPAGRSPSGSSPSTASSSRW